MEVVQFVSELISNVGFPIACVVALFWHMENERKSHKEESEKWVDALNRNTNVMEKILEKFEEK